MFKKLKTSYELVKVSFMYIKRDWELLIYSIFSLVSTLTILATFAWVQFFFVWDIDAITNQSDYLLYWYIFLYYLIFSFITFFFNTAIITSVQRRIEWKDNNFWDWLRDSMQHLQEIFIWSIINALVSTILKILQDKFWENSLIWRIIIWLIGWMWNILTFFSFPLMIVNKMWPREAIKESGNLFKKTWWERAMISVWVGLMFFLLGILVVLLSAWIIISGFVVTWIILVVVWIIFLTILSATCDVIIKTILLNYATTWSLPDELWDYKNIVNITKEL